MPAEALRRSRTRGVEPTAAVHDAGGGVYAVCVDQALIPVSSYPASKRDIIITRDAIVFQKVIYCCAARMHVAGQRSAWQL